MTEEAPMTQERSEEIRKKAETLWANALLLIEGRNRLLFERALEASLEDNRPEE